MKKSKRFKEIDKKIVPDQEYTLENAIKSIKDCPKVKFDETVEFSMMMGVDPKKSDQQIRGTVSLPHGTGKDIKVLVLTQGPKVQEATDAGADFVGSQEYIEKIQNGWTGFGAIVATPDMMREVGKLGKFLGPRGLMPSPKAGTVTNDVKQAVKDLKAGKIEFKIDKSGVINAILGKKSFSVKNLVENTEALIKAILRMKPASAKGIYMKSLFVSSTMGPGLKVQISN